VAYTENGSCIFGNGNATYNGEDKVEAQEDTSPFTQVGIKVI
jgi:hypothetical protein